MFLNEVARLVFTIIITVVKKNPHLVLTIATFLVHLSIKVPTDHESNTTVTVTTCHLGAKYYGKDQIIEPPNMIVFQSLSIFQEAVTYNDAVSLGTNLLDDKIGNKVEEIKDMTKGVVEDLKREIFRRWLKGEGNNQQIGIL